MEGTHGTRSNDRANEWWAITRGPAFHWFGYYDKLQFDPTGRHALGMAVAFEHRNPGPDDEIRVGWVDLLDGGRWTDLGTSRSWCWQQGCHLQWRPCSDREILWNDRRGDRFVGIVLDVKTGRTRTLPRPVDNLSPDGRWALSVDFGRVLAFRAGYGYILVWINGGYRLYRDEPLAPDALLWSASNGHQTYLPDECR
jgi:hypothetical protein